jgi:hypothetical protein
MKKTVFVFAAFAFCAASQQVPACDWGLHARNATPTIVACDSSGCAPLPPAQEATAPKTADDTASPAPTTVAQK